jgi:hypothetical protein
MDRSLSQKRRPARLSLVNQTTSRLYDTQATLVRTAKAAGDDCHYLLFKPRSDGNG